MHPGFLAASLSDRCNASVALQLGSTAEALAVFAEGDNESGREDRGRAGQCGE